MGLWRAPAAGGPELLFVVLQTFLVTVMVVYLLGLLPMRFFAGGTRSNGTSGRWGALLLVSGFAFWHVLVNPTSGYFGDFEPDTTRDDRRTADLL